MSDLAFKKLLKPTPVSFSSHEQQSKETKGRYDEDDSYLDNEMKLKDIDCDKNVLSSRESDQNVNRLQDASFESPDAS